MRWERSRMIVANVALYFFFLTKVIVVVIVCFPQHKSSRGKSTGDAPLGNELHFGPFIEKNDKLAVIHLEMCKLI